MPRGRKKQAKALRAEYTRTIELARALAAETLKLERALSGLVNQAYGLTPPEIDLMWTTAPPRMPIPPGPFCSHWLAGENQGVKQDAGHLRFSLFCSFACETSE